MGEFALSAQQAVVFLQNQIDLQQARDLATLKEEVTTFREELNTLLYHWEKELTQRILVAEKANKKFIDLSDREDAIEDMKHLCEKYNIKTTFKDQDLIDSHKVSIETAELLLKDIQHCKTELQYQVTDSSNKLQTQVHLSLIITEMVRKIMDRLSKSQERQVHLQAR